MAKLIKLFLLFLPLCLTSCGTWWQCYVDAIGQEPTSKTYFIENYFPEDLSPLVIAEYDNNLEKILAHKGYVRTDSANAGLKIAFGYVLGEVVDRAYNYSTPIYQYNPGTTTTSTTNATVKNSYGQTVATGQLTTTQKSSPSVDIVGTSSGTSYSSNQDVTIMLDAYYTSTKEPVWSVTITDNAEASTLQNMRRWMVYYLLNAEPYIGTNSGDRRYSKVMLNDKRVKEFNLPKLNY